MASSLALATVIIESRCPHCDSAMLVHDGTAGEITCQLCARVWECDPADPDHADCTHDSEFRRLPLFPRNATGPRGNWPHSDVDTPSGSFRHE
jgi:hypothetical protein